MLQMLFNDFSQSKTLWKQRCEKNSSLAENKKKRAGLAQFKYAMGKKELSLSMLEFWCECLFEKPSTSGDMTSSFKCIPSMSQIKMYNDEVSFYYGNFGFECALKVLGSSWTMYTPSGRHRRRFRCCRFSRHRASNALEALSIWHSTNFIAIQLKCFKTKLNMFITHSVSAYLAKIP